MGFEWNKIAAAFLAAAFVILGVNFLSDGIYHADIPETAGYAIEGGEVEVASGGAQAATVEPVAPLLASADIAAGQNVGKKCVACHAFDKGGANKVGPALYGIVNREIAAVDGFGYSSALKAYAEGGKQWTYDELNGFLYKPKSHVKGTSMGFAGIKKTDERAAMIAYLRSLADTPAPLPDPAAEPAAATEGAADTPTKDATIVTPAPGNASGDDEVIPSGGATGTQLTPKTEGEEPKAEDAPAAEGGEPKSEEAPATEGEAKPAEEAPKAEGESEPAQTEEAPTEEAPKTEEGGGSTDSGNTDGTATSEETPKAEDGETKTEEPKSD